MPMTSGGSRMLKGGGGVPLSRTFSTVFASDACTQNDKKGGSAEPKEPPLHPPLYVPI